MGFLDRLLGREDDQPQNNRAYNNGPLEHRWENQNASRSPQQVTDEQAVARYRYMLQSAPPEAIEQAHAEAFAKLTPEQRQIVLQQLSEATPDNERAALTDDPRSMARAATRAEMRQPGTMERSFGGMGGGMAGGLGMGMGGLMMGGLLTSIAGGFIGSAIASSFFNNPAVAQDYSQSDAAQEAGDTQMAENNFDGGVDSQGNYDSYGDPGDNVDPMGDPADSGNFADAGGDWGGDFGGDFGGEF